MNLNLMKAWLTRWEGSRAQAYDDATGKPLTGQPCIGNPTIGLGLNLRTAAACSAITALGLDFEDVLAGHAGNVPCFSGIRDGAELDAGVARFTGHGMVRAGRIGA